MRSWQSICCHRPQPSQQARGVSSSKFQPCCLHTSHASSQLSDDEAAEDSGSGFLILRVRCLTAAGLCPLRDAGVVFALSSSLSRPCSLRRSRRSRSRSAFSFARDSSIALSITASSRCRIRSSLSRTRCFRSFSAAILAASSADALASWSRTLCMRSSMSR